MEILKLTDESMLLNIFQIQTVVARIWDKNLHLTCWKLP